MNHLDLESKIKSMRVPERDGEFWQTLPERVLAQAEAQAQDARAQKPAAPHFHYSLFGILSSKFVLACLLAGFCLWQTRMPQTISYKVLKNGRAVRQALAQWPGRLDTLMRDEHGLHNLIQDPP